MKSRQVKYGLIRLNPVATSFFLSLPFMVQAENIAVHKGVTTIVNGVAVVDINAANSNGISHNIYEDFNVDRNGLIFNNSQKDIATVLAGNIAGNKNLATGTAKVILNEVISKKQSTLDGMMEVAGDKAHLIIANPNGITMQSGGFINTEKSTLTTGKPDIENGILKGYSVNGGKVNLGSLQSASPTEILARAVVVNGVINTDKLTVVAGNNYVNTKTEIMGEVKAQGLKSSYGVDVSKLGGMYANRISLISTENGVGVRNAGIVAGGAEGIQIDSNGKLINSNGEMKSLAAIKLKTNGTLDNVTGKIASLDNISIDTNKNTINNARAGEIVAGTDISLVSGAFDNINGRVAAGGELAINTNNKTLTNTGKGETVGMEGKTVTLQTGTLNNNGGQIYGQNVRAYATTVNNVKGAIEADESIELDSNNDVDNNKGLLRTKNGYIQIAAARTFTNSNNITADAISSDSLGVLAGGGGIRIKANTLDNKKGKMASSGNIDLESKGTLYNVDGQITSNQNVSVLSAGTLKNNQGKITASQHISLVGRGAIDNSCGAILSDGTISVSANSFDNGTYAGFVMGDKGVNIDIAGTFDNHIGAIRAEDGDIEMKVNRLNNNGGMILGQNINISSTSTLDNSYGLMVADKKLTINAADVNNRHGDSFGSVYGKYFNISGQPGGLVARASVDITAKNLDNDYSRIISEAGTLTMNIEETLSSDRALLVAGSDTTIKAKKLSNNYSTLYSGGNLIITTASLQNSSSGSLIDNNETGVIASDKKMLLEIGSNFTNYGWISGKEASSVNINGALVNYNAISSVSDLTLTTKGTLTNYRDIAAGSVLTVKTENSISNASGGNISGKETLVDVKKDIKNLGNIVATDNLTVNAQGNIYNYSNIYTQGKAEVSAKIITNSGANALLGGRNGLQINAEKINSSGRIIGL
ncbi:two-partner secretion domain-containing protein [Vagococcus sp. WN89Y]|uniref:two-partner secretion domain-containing protein n=1 Tax=Vagococcus sp. WN89Y TaxID=3457258 RepID=UPI003FCDA4E5